MSLSPEPKERPSNSFSNRRSSSLLFDSGLFTFQPEINSYSHQLTIQTHSNIHERLYQASKIKKRCESYKKNISVQKRTRKVNKNNLYIESQVQKAQNRKKCLMMRRNLSQNEEKELKFKPRITKFHFSAPRGRGPLEDYLLLSEQYKKADRFKLIRKYNKAL